MSASKDFEHKGIRVYMTTTSTTSGASLVLSVKGKDAEGNIYTILSTAAITTNSSNMLTIYPGITATANVSANTVLPYEFYIDVIPSDTKPVTYEVSYDLIP